MPAPAPASAGAIGELATVGAAAACTIGGGGLATVGAAAAAASTIGGVEAIGTDIGIG